MAITRTDSHQIKAVAILAQASSSTSWEASDQAVAMKRLRQHDEPKHSWEASDRFSRIDAAFEWNSFDGGESSDDELTTAGGTAMFIDLLTSMALQGTRMSKKHCCLLSYFAGVGGLAGVSELGLPPGLGSGKYAPHFDKFMKVDKTGQYELGLPGHYKRTDVAADDFEAVRSRGVNFVGVLNPHEVLSSEVIATPSLVTELADRHRTGDLPPVYYSHPIYKQCAPGELPFPTSIYFDATPYSKKDGVLSVIVCNQISQVFHLVASVRRSIFCRCSSVWRAISGWCTLYALMAWLEWSLSAWAGQRVGDGRHDGAPWRDSDVSRQGNAGCRLAARGMTIYIKGAWAEWEHTL